MFQRRIYALACAACTVFLTNGALGEPSSNQSTAGSTMRPVSQVVEPLAASPVSFRWEGKAYRLSLEPVRVRSQNFRVTLRGSQGDTLFDPGESRTRIGTIQGVPGAYAVGHTITGAFEGLVSLPEWGTFEITPLRAGEDTITHAVYPIEDADMFGDVTECGVVGDDAPVLAEQHGIDRNGDVFGSESPVCEPGPFTALVACDSDNEFFVGNAGSDPATGVAVIETAVAFSNFRFRSENGGPGIDSLISEIILRPDPLGDPYSSHFANGLLTDARLTHSSTFAQRGLSNVVVFIGRDVELPDRDIGGIAYLGGSGSAALGYSIVDTSEGSANFWGLTTTHELGHQWGAGHCNPATSPCGGCVSNVSVMNGTVPAFPTISRFQPCSVEQMYPVMSRGVGDGTLHDPVSAGITFQEGAGEITDPINPETGILIAGLSGEPTSTVVTVESPCVVRPDLLLEYLTCESGAPIPDSMQVDVQISDLRAPGQNVWSVTSRSDLAGRIVGRLIASYPSGTVQAAASLPFVLDLSEGDNSPGEFGLVHPDDGEIIKLEPPGQIGRGKVSFEWAFASATRRYILMVQESGCPTCDRVVVIVDSPCRSRISLEAGSQDSDLPPGTYDWWVIAENNNGQSRSLEVRSLTVIESPGGFAGSISADVIPTGVRVLHHSPAADVDLDGDVDMDDALAVLAVIQTESIGLEDLNRDGIVDVMDLDLVLSAHDRMGER